MEAVPAVLGGYSKSAELQTQATLAEMQARDVSTQALQASGQRREQLHASLAAIDAHRAASNVSLDSPTGIAIGKEVRRQSVTQEGIQKLGYLNQQGALKFQAQQYRRSSKYAVIQGWLGGYQALEDTAAKAMGA